MEPSGQNPEVTCAECGTVLREGQDREVTDDGTFCRTCFDKLTAELRQALAAQGTDVNYPAALLGGVLGGVAGAVVWWGFTVVTRISFGLVAVVIGVAVGKGVVLLSGNKRHFNLQILSVVVSVVAYFYASFLVNRTFIQRAFAERGETLIIPFLPEPDQFFRVVTAGFDVMDLVFLAIVVWEAWKIPAPIRLGGSTEATRDLDSAPPAKKRLAALGPIGAVIALGLGKLKLLLPLIKFTKLGTLLTMLLSVWAYALYWGLPFAVGFVLLIFVHEAGHALVMQRLGLPAGAPVFIPFVGAVIAMKSQPRDAYVEALVGIGGPALGSLGALVCLVVGWTTGSLFWFSLASTGFLINLFNLIPISPLDGGRVVGVISRWLWLAGYAVGVGVFLATRSPMLFLILLLGLFSLPRTLRGPREGYFNVPPARRVAVGAFYFGLMAALAVGMWMADRRLEGLRPNLRNVAGARFTAPR